MALVRIRGVSHEPPDRILQLQQLLHEGGVRIFNIAPSMLAEIITERKWVGRCNGAGEGFRSFADFAHQPLWDGLDCTMDDLLAICRKRQDVQRLIKKEIGAAEISGRHSHTIVGDLYGGNPTYTLRRLKRDRPDLAEKVIAGELSANAAAVKAGFRKKLTPFEIVKRQIPKLTAKERSDLKDLL